MLDFMDRRSTRRSFLSVGSLGMGALGLGGLSLSGLLQRQAAAAAGGAPGGILRDKAVIFLFMHGGPSQIETFDPKMTAPTGIQSVTGEIPTAIKGVTYGSTFPRLAKLADKTTIVRSFRTGDGNHDIKPIVSRHSGGANLGSVYARIAGANHPENGMPRNVAIFPRAIDPNAKERVSNFGRFESTGSLGPAFAPFIPGVGGPMQENLTLRIERNRLNDRRALLTNLDRIKRHLELTNAMEGVDRFQAQAFDTIIGGVADAFDLSKENPRTVARYDTSPLVDPDSIRKVWNNHRNYRDHSQTLGKLMLMARRLIERGCGFVTVTTNFVWDMHADQNNATMTEGMEYCGGPFDHAVSAFIEDCEARGLRDKVLLVCVGEMGRTPKVNGKGGRDHWGNLAPLMLYGGGLNMGQVIGESSRDAGEPHTEPVTIDHLNATIMHTLFDIGELRITPSAPADAAKIATAGQVIPGIM